MTQSKYREAGVDIDAGNAFVDRVKPAARSTDRPGTMGGIGGFGAMFDLKAAGFHDPVLVASTDGVGTKVKLALDASDVSGLGVDLVAMCANDLIVQGAEPLFFLDYFATGKLDIALADTLIESIAEGCRQAGCALIGGETAEMPGLYAGRDFDLAGFVVGAAERGTLLPRTDLAAGDIVVGLPSSGVHSNGYSLVRKVVRDTGLQLTDEAPFAPGAALGPALLAPTRIYVKTALAAHRAGLVKAIAHITGGGLTENPPRVVPDALAFEIDLSAIAVPPVFAWLARAGAIDESEMLRTFNCGIGLVLVAGAAEADQLVAQLRLGGETPVLLGRLAPRKGDAVVYRGRLGI